MKAAQLKALLSQVPDDAEVLMHDTVTDWTMPQFELRELDSGQYVIADAGSLEKGPFLIRERYRVLK